MGGGDYCALVSRTDEALLQSQQNAAITNSNNPTNDVKNYILVLCNAIGTPLESKYIDIEPLFAHMNSSHVIVASKSYFYIWNYQSMMDHSSLKRQTAEKYAIHAKI